MVRIQILSDMNPITLDEKTSIRMLEARLANNNAASNVKHLFPTENSLNGLVSLDDLMTDFGRHDLNGTRLVTYGANHKILEVDRMNGKISSSQEMGYDVFQVIYRKFCQSLESALWNVEYRFPEIFPASSLAVGPELFARLFIETYTLPVPPKLSPEVIYSPHLPKYFADKYLANPPYIRQDMDGRTEITKNDKVYTLKEYGERGNDQKTMVSPDPIELSEKYMKYFFGC